MVHAYHVIFGAYGFWLPNDPRGSWSTVVRAWELRRFGPATKTDQRRSVAAKPHDHALRRAAKKVLKYPAVQFSGVQARAVGQGCATAASKSDFTIWACSVLPDHVHLVIARHHLDVEQMVNLLKGEATKQLKQEGIHPLAGFKDRQGRIPKAFAERQWAVFLDHPIAIRRAIRYVENNPDKERKPPQRWTFVTPFDETMLSGFPSPLAQG